MFMYLQINASRSFDWNLDKCLDSLWTFSLTIPTVQDEQGSVVFAQINHAPDAPLWLPPPPPLSSRYFGRVRHLFSPCPLPLGLIAQRHLLSQTSLNVFCVPYKLYTPTSCAVALWFSLLSRPCLTLSIARRLTAIREIVTDVDADAWVLVKQCFSPRSFPRQKVLSKRTQLMFVLICVLRLCLLKS